MEYKFKKGDRVRLLPGNEDYLPAKTGDCGTVQDNCSAPDVKWDHSGEVRVANEVRLEPILPEQTPTKGQILSALEKYPEAKKALNELYPDVVKKEMRLAVKGSLILDTDNGWHVATIYSDNIYILSDFTPKIKECHLLNGHRITFTRK